MCVSKHRIHNWCKLVSYQNKWVVGRIPEVKRPRQLLAGGTIFYIFVLIGTLIYLRTPAYQGSSYKIITPPLYIALSSCIIALLPVTWLPITFDRPTKALYIILYYSAFIPSVMVPIFLLTNYLPLIGFSAAFCVCFRLLQLIYRVPLYSPPSIPLSPAHAWSIIIGGWLALLIFVQATIGLRFGIPSFGGIYRVRELYTQDVGKLPSIVGRFVKYSVDWLKNVFAPLLFAPALADKSRFSAIFGLFGVVTLYLVFALTGYKSAFFVPVAIVGLYISLSRDGKYFIPLLLGGFLIGLLGTVFINLITGLVAPLSLVRRFLIVPGVVSGYFIDFFHAHPKTLMSERFFIQPFIDYPYSMQPARVIGERYMWDGTYANAHMWAEGYMSFGVIGMVLFTAIFAGVCWAYDSITQNLRVNIAGALLAAMVIVFINTDIITALVTHGMALLLVLMYILVSTNSDNV